MQGHLERWSSVIAQQPTQKKQVISETNNAKSDTSLSPHSSEEKFQDRSTEIIQRMETEAAGATFNSLALRIND